MTTITKKAVLKKVTPKKIAKVKKEVDPKGEIWLNDKQMYEVDGERAKLLTEACDLNRIKKNAEKRLAEIRKEIDINDKGVYVNYNNDQLTVVESIPKSDIDPKELYAYMLKEKKLESFWTSVKVGITELKKHLSEGIVDGLRHDLDPVLKFTYK